MNVNESKKEKEKEKENQQRDTREALDYFWIFGGRSLACKAFGKFRIVVKKALQTLAACVYAAG